MAFANIEVKTTAQELVQEALERQEALMVAKGYVGWKAQAANVLTIAFEALGPMASDMMQVAAALPAAAFRSFGTQLEGVPYNQGARATAATLWALLPENGEYKAHTIPQGTQLAIGNLGFYVETPVEVKAGESTIKVHVVAVEEGSEYNKVTGTVELVESINWVGEITLEGETANGADPETTEEYLNRLAARQTIRAEVPITAADYSTFARNVPSGILPAGIVVGRATSIDGYNPATTSFTGTTTEHSNIVTEVSSFTGITIGTELEGAGIPEGATVTALKTSENKLTISTEATASHSKETIKAIGSYENERYDCTFVADKEGKALSTEAMEKLEAWLAEHREIGFRTPVRAPSYNPIYTTSKIHVLPGYEEAGVIAAVKTAQETYLSPALWANPTRAETGANAWLNKIQGFNIVRYNQLIGIIEAVPGVAYLFPGSEGLKIGKNASPTGTTDLTMVGPAPLPEAKTITVTAG